MSEIYRRVALIGLGLIASSMAHRIRASGLAGEIIGTARSKETREIAAEMGLSRERVRQLEHAAIRKLRGWLDADGAGAA